MLYSYSLSVYSVNFFLKPSFTKFKLRLINQQTSDCTQSKVLDANQLAPKSFPIIIKLKGSERLLLKIKLLSVLSGNSEFLIGEGVVNIDSKIIDNSIRVPIYDKQQGVEEVAICSVDFFVTGFSIQKNSFSYIEKSQSKINDMKDRSEDAVFSQMSYTIESQSHISQQQQQLNQKKLSRPNHINTSKPNNQNTSPNMRPFQQDSVINLSIISPKEKLPAKTSQGSPRKQVKEQEINNKYRKSKDFHGQIQQQAEYRYNVVYLKPNTDQSIKKKQKQRSPKERQIYKKQVTQEEKRKQNLLLDSSQKYLSQVKDPSIDLSPEKIKIQFQENEKVLEKLKIFLKKQEQQQSQAQSMAPAQKNRIKHRRKNLKIQAIQSYRYQTKFIKYHLNMDDKPMVLLKNVRAIRIIQNELKESHQQIIKQPINKLVIAYMNNQKIVSFDSLGYRSYCISNAVGENSIDIHIPFDQTSLKVAVDLNDEGEFQGTLGLQEGQDMAIRLYRKNKSEKPSILTKEVFKLYIDIKSFSSPTKNDIKESKPLDQTLRQNDDSFRTDLTFKERIQSISIQPWGYIQNHIKEQTKLVQKMTVQISKPKQNPFKNRIDDLINKKKNIYKKGHLSGSNFEQNESKLNKFMTSEQNDNESSYEKQIPKLNIKLYKQKKEDQRSQNENSEIKQINNIRNGNRNNYKYRQREQQKIKELWQELLIKKKLEEEKKVKKQLDVYRKQVNKSIVKNKNSRQNSLYSPISHYHSSSNQSKAFKILPTTKVNKIQTKLSQDESLRYIQYPLKQLSLQINNISITEAPLQIDEDLESQNGKFIKISMNDKTDYYTEVIFNGDYNSILWKLQGCFFNDLDGNEKLELQVYKTMNNKIKLIGKVIIRLQKLIFLRNNHIYNGKILYQDILNGQFTLGFNISENIPFEIVEEEDQNGQFQDKRNKYAQLGNSYNYRAKNSSLTNKFSNNNGKYIQSPSKINRNPQIVDKDMIINKQLMNTLRKNTNSGTFKNKIDQTSIDNQNQRKEFN